MATNNSTYDAQRRRPGKTGTDRYLEGMGGQKENRTAGEQFDITERRLQPQVHGFLGALADLPGMRLRKLGDTMAVIDPKTGEVIKPGQAGELTYDFYNPFTEKPRPDEYSSYQEELERKSGEGAGGLFNAATLVPGLLRSGGRAVAGAFAKKRAGQASEQLGEEVARTAEAADWMNPATRSRPKPGAALSGQEAQDVLNASPGRREVAEAGVGAAQRGVREAANLGSQYDNVIDALTKSQTVMRPIASAGSALLNRSASEIDAENSAKNALPQEEVGTLPAILPSDAGGKTNVPTTATQPKRSDAESFRASMTGKQLTPYKTSAWERFRAAVAPIAFGVPLEDKKRRVMENEAYANAYMDPESQYRLQQTALDRNAERGIATGQAVANTPEEKQENRRKFAGTFAPGMNPRDVEQIFELPEGSIDPQMMANMARRNQGDSPLDDIYAMIAQQMAARSAQQTGGKGMPTSNKVNPNRQINVPK